MAIHLDACNGNWVLVRVDNFNCVVSIVIRNKESLGVAEHSLLMEMFPGHRHNKVLESTLPWHVVI